MAWATSLDSTVELREPSKQSTPHTFCLPVVYLWSWWCGRGVGAAAGELSPSSFRRPSRCLQFIFHIVHRLEHMLKAPFTMYFLCEGLTSFWQCWPP